MTPSMVPIDAFKATEYRVMDGDVRVVVRIDAASPELDALLDRHGARHGVFLTAWNPRSEPRADAENQQANNEMDSVLGALGAKVLPHVGASPDGNWSEEGCFALDLHRDVAASLAERFGQYAIVIIQRGCPVELLLTAVAERP